MSASRSGVGHLDARRGLLAFGDKPPPPPPSQGPPSDQGQPPEAQPPEPGPPESEEPEPPERPEERKDSFLGRLALMEWLLKYQEHVFDDIVNEQNLPRYLVDSLLVTILGGVFYGFVVGISVGGWQILYNPVKMPWIMVFTLALCLPCLYIFSSYLGSRLSLAQTCTIAFTATAVMSTILVGFAPVTWFFMFTAPGAYEFGILINVLVFAVSGFLGVQFLFRAAASMTPDREAESPIVRMLKWWVVLYAVVGAQMGWLLRPFFNATDVFIRPRSGNFFVAVLRTLWAFLEGSGG
ncbi:MAG: hypothetical protein U9R79_19345 [Armatimonadota bacterium]|nr:hypothetical protein [Armatimonadota bacterium]